MAQKQVKIEAPRDPYKRLMPFNRFHVERIGGIVVMHFGLVNNSGLLMDSYSCAIFQFELEAQRESLMQYLGQLGSLGDAPPAWQPPAAGSRVDIVNHIGVSSNPEVAETTLNNFPVRAITEARAKGGTIYADPVALLRCTQEIQKHWIKELFPIQ